MASTASGEMRGVSPYCTLEATQAFTYIIMPSSYLLTVLTAKRRDDAKTETKPPNLSLYLNMLVFHMKENILFCNLRSVRGKRPTTPRIIAQKHTFLHMIHTHVHIEAEELNQSALNL